MAGKRRRAFVPQSVLDEQHPTDFSVLAQLEKARKRFKLKPGEGPVKKRR